MSIMATIARYMENDIGRHVKRADLIDNMDIMRISDPTDADFKLTALQAGYKLAQSALGWSENVCMRYACGE